ncbi:MAG: right-handed parallel beta-helix repeat-containing protein [Pirellulaceae bacterium]|jgi:hypothetical protein|nr:right-handed parallel beta-helix repeat-containing protein [Pirellulaceae bacterium]
MRTTCLRAFLFGFLLPSLGLAAEDGGPPVQPWFPKAPPLARPAGPVVRVAGVDELYAAARDIQPGGTILVADGHYRLPRYFELRTDNVTLRSESGQRDNVVLDGQGRLGELVGITGCSGVTIADLTVQNVKWNGIKLNSDRGVNRVTIYNCVIHNVWQRGIKGVMVPQQDRQRLRPSDCRVQYCLFYNDRPKRYEDDEADRPDNFGGNYIGGIDVMYAQRWTLSDNVFVGIQGRTGEARGAIFLWVDARDCVIERNIVIDCDSGICLGNSHRGADTPVHCSGCVVRNNFVTRCPENGILADYTRDCRILHNTIHDPGSRLRRLIRLVHDNDGLVVANNLLSGPEMRVETSSPVRIAGNQSRDASDWFVQADRGDLHWKTDAPSVIPRVTRSEDVLEDIDGQRRGDRTAVGADDVPEQQRPG